MPANTPIVTPEGFAQRFPSLNQKIRDLSAGDVVRLRAALHAQTDTERMEFLSKVSERGHQVILEVFAVITVLAETNAGGGQHGNQE